MFPEIINNNKNKFLFSVKQLCYKFIIFLAGTITIPLHPIFLVAVHPLSIPPTFIIDGNRQGQNSNKNNLHSCQTKNLLEFFSLSAFEFDTIHFKHVLFTFANLIYIHTLLQRTHCIYGTVRQPLPIHPTSSAVFLFQQPFSLRMQV